MPSPPSTSPSGTPDVSVAFLFDSTPQGAVERVLPALRSVELAFATASLSTDGRLAVDVVPLDVAGTEPADVPNEVAGDPSYVAAIAAPDLSGQAAIVKILGAANVPLLSLSARDSVTAAPAGTWLRFVAPVRVQADAVADEASSLHASRKGVCVVATPPDGSDFARQVDRSLWREVEVSEVDDASGVTEAGCRVVVWTGQAEGAADLTIALRSSAGKAPALVGGPGLLERPFLDLAGDAAQGAISLCSCADVGTSLDLAAQRFVQDYQSQNGSPPGPYAVEAWDAAHELVRALDGGGRTRLDVVRWLAGVSDVEGLGGTYAFASGELARPASAIRRYRVEGGRWVLASRG